MSDGQRKDRVKPSEGRGAGATGGLGATRRSAKESFRFTKRALEGLEPPGEGRRSVYDTEVRHLSLCVTAGGSRSFYLIKRVNGRARRLRLGGFPNDLTVEAARKLAQKQLIAIADGQDPSEDKRVIRRESSLESVFALYVEQHAKPHKRTWGEDQRIFDKHLKPWHKWRLSDIKTSHVAALHAKIGKESGPYMANRTLALETTVFNFAIDRNWKGLNPARSVTRFPEVERERFMDAGELERFFRSLKKEPDATLRDFFLTCLFSGARRGNVMAMAWEHVDLDRGVWTIPPAQLKTKRGMSVVLPPPLIEILRQRLEQNEDESPFVFASKRSKSGHVEDPKFAWARVLKRAKIKNLRMHDLRRTLGSWQAAAGASLHIIGKSLGHMRPETTKIYAQLNLDPVRRSVGAATAAMLEAMPKEDEDDE